MEDKEEEPANGMSKQRAKKDEDVYEAAPNILENGMCRHCDNTVDMLKEAIQCFKCKNRFHAVGCKSDYCVTGAKQAFTNTLLPAVSNAKPFVNKFGRFLWLCDFCSKSDLEIIHPGTVSTQSNDCMDNMEDISNKFVALKSELMSSLNTVIDTKLDAILTKLDTTQNPMSCATAAANGSQQATVPSVAPPPVRDVKAAKTPCEVLVLNQSSENDPKDVDINRIKRSITSSLKNVQVTFISANEQSKKISVGFPDSKSRDAGETAINQSEFLASVGYETKKANKMLPKVTIHHVDNSVLEDIDTTDCSIEEIRDLEKKMILEKVLVKNTAIKALVDNGHTFSVVYLNKSNVGNKDITVAFKISPAIRTAILERQKGHIFVDGQSYSISDRFHLKHCYHCQLLGHISTECPDKKKVATCLYCMGGHRSKECQYKNIYSKHCCAKCLASKHGDDANKYRSHNSASSECPVLLREQQRIANMTDFVSRERM